MLDIPYGLKLRICIEADKFKCFNIYCIYIKYLIETTKTHLLAMTFESLLSLSSKCKKGSNMKKCARKHDDIYEGTLGYILWQVKLTVSL